MRYGLLSDVHANAHALEAALALLEREGVDGYLCAGDLIGYGPAPDACVDRVLGLPGVRCIAGNHELIALGRLGLERCSATAAESLRWTAGVLGGGTRERLAALPATVSTPDGGVVAHGSLDDPQTYIETPPLAAEQLRALGDRDRAARALVLGHTHASMAVDARGRTLLRSGVGTVRLAEEGATMVNPGSVGQPRGADPRARVAVLDLGCGEVHFHAVRWDVGANRAALVARGRPPHANFRRVPVWRRAARGVRGTTRRAVMREHPPR